MEVWLEDKQESVIFLTNNLEFAATTISAIYKDRRKVELFFKAIKQNLKIKTFLGTSPNAVKTQIWTALIAMLILKYLQLRPALVWLSSIGSGASIATEVLLSANPAVMPTSAVRGKLPDTHYFPDDHGALASPKSGCR